jgi:hypothetical protein
MPMHVWKLNGSHALIDHLGPEPDRRDIVNWDYVGGILGASVEKVGEEVREEVHEATAPDGRMKITPAHRPTLTPNNLSKSLRRKH